ncbi:MAG TPA: M14 family zinc carboxypeptidase [Baekduia sp.]|uniref:M14 family zinc carboxypeptidase n=1 Tax=Baekduia sp. TaxID=2600305 RepID=UPI002D7785F3|nr:M14 family zinc carboxypeptidase [Baekduia sp.]HET6507230.1 M14 family zinc carboxypeptidase [Baekduia sp.]
MATVATAALPGIASAADCTSSLTYDPNVPTWDQYFSQHPDDGAIQPFAAGGPGRSTGKNTTHNLDLYFDAVTAAVNSSPGTKDRVGIVKKYLGKSELGNRGVDGRDIAFWVIGTKANIDNLDTPGGDAEFWAGVRGGTISEADGLAGATTRPTFGWVTATPHGNEPAAGEAIARELYELAARLDCENLDRLKKMDTFLMPVRNPDGRDNNVRTTSWAFDPNRDFGTRNQVENDIFIPEMNKYPGVFFIDAHQQTTGYFFPPNEDPVHHEISSFSLDFIQNTIGPALQRVFNDQSSQYQNYNSYDMFTPEYGDTVPSLIMGAAGMTYEKGTDESYSKQVYDHYLAIDTTINLTVQDKVNIQKKWVAQWQQAIDQGAACELQPNKLVSPLHDTIQTIVPEGGQDAVCGYFYKPSEHTGDVAALLQNLTQVGVHVYRFASEVTLPGVREFGKDATSETLPAGTLYIPMAQPMKHWVQAVLGQDPFIPYNYYYDVVDWSYSTQRGLAGDGWLTQNPPATVTASMIPVTDVDLSSYPATSSPVYAFDTDSMQSLALVAELLDKGVTVYRGVAPFTANGVSYASGAAMVSRADLESGAADLRAMAKARNVQVTGLGAFPVARKALAKPKIGLYTGSATIPTNPINQAGPNVTGNTGQCTSTVFCQAYFTLTQKDKLPTSMIVPVTTADLQGGVLASGRFTALINPTTSIATSDATSLSAISAFVNAGGVYVGNLAGGTTTARNASMTTANTSTISGLNTPGTTFDARFDTTNPVAWGFDEGGWIYRDANSDPTYDPATLGGNGTTIPAASAVVSYAGTTTGGGLRAYGYQVNALGAGKLDGRPAVIDQPLGSGHAVLIGFDPFFRAWKEQDERIVLNAVLYPLGASLPASRSTVTPTASQLAAAIEPVAKPLAKAEMPKVATSSKAVAVATTDRDVRIAVKTKQLSSLRKAVKAAKLPKSAMRKVKYAKTKGRVTFVVKGVRPLGTDHHPHWIGRVMHQLSRQRVKPISAQL